MSTAQTVLLGAIAGFTIYLGLPLGRVRLASLKTRAFLNSNSVIAWLLARSDLPTDVIWPPAGGRAPGWLAGLVMARRQQQSNQQAGQAAGIVTAPVAARS